MLDHSVTDIVRQIPLLNQLSEKEGILRPERIFIEQPGSKIHARRPESKSRSVQISPCRPFTC